MGELNFTKQDISKTLIKKLKISLRSRKERIGWYIVNDKKILRVTIPHGRGFIPSGTLNSIRNQLQLDKEQFKNLILCPMKEKDYEEIMRKKDKI